jgi:streptomycin 6-kinase
MLDPEFVLDEAARERLMSRFGAGTSKWCAALPGLVERCCSRWDLRLDNAQSGSTSRVYGGRQGNRAQPREVVLKLTPDPAIARAEAVALRAWAASPQAVTLLDADLDTGALLLERLRPGITLRDAGSPPCWGDPAFDVVDWVLWPRDRGQLGRRIGELCGLSARTCRFRIDR